MTTHDDNERDTAFDDLGQDQHDDPNDTPFIPFDDDTDEDEETPNTSETDPADQLRFRSLPDFVDWVASWYRRDIVAASNHAWYARWWEIPELWLRFDACWRAFEELRVNPGTGLSTFIRDHLDYHMGVIMARDYGPLMTYTEASDDTRSEGRNPLPVVAPPEAMFERY